MSDTMRAVAQLGQAFNVSVIDLPVPTIINATDVIVRINATAICGSDLHTYRTAMGSPEQPYLYGHEAIGYVTEVGDAVQFLEVGDYVVIPDNIDNGHYALEPDSYVVPLGWGGLEGGEALPGLQTWMGLTWSGFQSGDSVAVMGAGPVGLLAAYSALARGASQVFVVDEVQQRLDLAESIGAIPINFNNSDPVEQILATSPGGVRRGVEAVGYEAVNSTGQVDAGITLQQLLNVTAPEGGIGIVGLFPNSLPNFDIGQAWQKTLTIDGGVVLPLQIASEIVPLVASGRLRPSLIVSSIIDIEDAPEYYRRFNNHDETKVVIQFHD
ncbi:hypothetical protein LTR64_008784 [Lithohypha guttulata]|uniref:uncharacterized protein n=1 Tax=Lithohypha guttulata TaxID=1690604 RepID=UPI002DDDDC98|nr:hypothetical protein LTR51_008809 [Lithohypha guttulata]